MTVKVLSVAQSEAKYTFNLRTALYHFLAHPKLGVLYLFYLSQVFLDLSLQVTFTSAAEPYLWFK